MGANQPVPNAGSHFQKCTAYKNITIEHFPNERVHEIAHSNLSKPTHYLSPIKESWAICPF